LRRSHAEGWKEAQALRARAGELRTQPGQLLNSTAMANQQPDQQRNAAIKPGLWIQLCVVILGLFTVGAASACSCSQVGVENLVLDKRLSLAKVVVVPPTFTDRIASLLNFFKADSPESRTYRVKVLEVITGRYDATALKVQSSVSSDCGVDLRHGETYYHRASSTAAGGDIYASVCNLVDEEYVRQVKAYKRRPKPELSPVPSGSWTEIFSSAKQTVHADYRSVTSDSYGHYVWILRNLADDGRVKSEKAQLQIACKERQYNVVSRHEFSGMDASGEAISSVNLSERGHYQWLAMKPDIDGLFPVVCRGQLQRPTS
jgi:hypothetical protein